MKRADWVEDTSDLPKVTVEVAKLGFEPRNLGTNLMFGISALNSAMSSRAGSPGPRCKAGPPPLASLGLVCAQPRTVSQGVVFGYPLRAWHRVGTGTVCL